MLKAIAILAAILIFVAIPASSASKPPIPGAGKVASPNQRKPGTHDQRAADNERGTPAAPLVVEMQNPSNTDAIAAELKKNRENQATENWRSLIFNSLLVGVGVLQAIALCFTVFVTNKAANAAKAAAEAAKQSADSLRNIERAYVFIDYELLRERNAVLKVGGISQSKQIELVFKNFGRTPAIVNGINCKCHHWPNRHLPEMETDSIKIPSGIAIGSSSPWSIPAVFEGTACDINDAMSGAGSIYLYGKITYLDMLGEQRETGFCCEWSFAEGQFFMAPNTKLNYHT